MGKLTEEEFYVSNGSGAFLGAFFGTAPEDAMKVPSPPEDARQLWDFNSNSWGDPPLPSVEDYQNAIQALVDETARAKLFNDGVTMASYVASTVEPWAAQAQAFVAWRDNVWQYAYSELAKVQGGERAQPTVEEFLPELPEIIWP